MSARLLSRPAGHTFTKLFSVTFILTAAGAVFTTRATPAVPQAISTVMVEVVDASTHGSGVYIGRGTVLTAAHVVGKNTAMTVVDSLGHKQPATVVRLNKDTDVALLHIVSTPMASTPLDCSVRTEIGDEVMAIGNPLSLKFVRVWGRVSTDMSPRYTWKQSLIINMATVPGMSGGGVFNKAGKLVGITVGVASQGGTQYALGYVVPVQAACDLVGRADHVARSQT